MTGYLQGRVRVREELSKVLLFVKNDKFRSERPRTIILGFTHREPRSSLRSRNRTGFADAGFVEALSILIGCAICLSSWFHPDDSINELVRSVGSRSWSESFFFQKVSALFLCCGVCFSYDLPAFLLLHQSPPLRVTF